MAKLHVRVQPGAKRDQLLGFQEGVLRVKLAAPAVQGRANKALVDVLAGWLAIPKLNVSVVAGFTARDKLVEVAGLAQEEMISRLEALLSG